MLRWCDYTASSFMFYAETVVQQWSVPNTAKDSWNLSIKLAKTALCTYDTQSNTKALNFIGWKNAKQQQNERTLKFFFSSKHFWSHTRYVTSHSVHLMIKIRWNGWKQSTCCSMKLEWTTTHKSLKTMCNLLHNVGLKSGASFQKQISSSMIDCSSTNSSCNIHVTVECSNARDHLCMEHFPDKGKPGLAPTFKKPIFLRFFIPWKFLNPTPQFHILGFFWKKMVITETKNKQQAGTEDQNDSSGVCSIYGSCFTTKFGDSMRRGSRDAWLFGKKLCQRTTYPRWYSNLNSNKKGNCCLRLCLCLCLWAAVAQSVNTELLTGGLGSNLVHGTFSRQGGNRLAPTLKNQFSWDSSSPENLSIQQFSSTCWASWKKNSNSRKNNKKIGTGDQNGSCGVCLQLWERLHHEVGKEHQNVCQRNNLLLLIF